MPQLNPAPWFAILLFSWLIFLAIIPLKIMAHTSPNEAALECIEALKAEPWAWPWY
uniref:ATP synthase complex subunit 8 n=1 Tax=Chrysiptera rex TaxID=80980 RepID=Q7Y7L4_CHRRE|nr:ATP synthase 8 [Chrysiptera rex]AAP75337.1 ATP synthase 8 [Chrysiptera rex]